VEFDFPITFLGSPGELQSLVPCAYMAGMLLLLWLQQAIKLVLQLFGPGYCRLMLCFIHACIALDGMTEGRPCKNQQATF
jgi:hypothetical protein